MSDSRVGRALNRLIERMVDGLVVPFLGAGISVCANHRGGVNGLTDTCCMTSRVTEALQGRCQSGSCTSPASCVVKREIDCEDQIPFGKVCEFWEWCFGKGEQGRCELVYHILMIPEFGNLEPTDAHRYIAFLAREGLIDEIITTNYDTCIEEAYRNTFGLGNDLPANSDPALVIDSLDEYQDEGGTRYTDERVRRRCLRIYKINGCAAKLHQKCQDGHNEYCKDILLTEKDLQDWRKRSWARDLFRDRLRSRTIVFSGFGSDEPQVRHTALQVCEEFASVTREHTSSVWDKQNAPFVAAFESSLSFSQTQILRAYAQSFGFFASPEKLWENTFSGSDKDFFCPGHSSEAKLPADVFWKRVFQAAFWRLSRKACRSDSAIISFLSPVLPCASSLLAEMLDWLDPDRRFGRFPEMLDLAEGTDRTIPLAAWISCARGVKPENKTGWYSPLVDRPVLIPAILLLIYLLLGLQRREIPWGALKEGIRENVDGLGLWVDGDCLIGNGTPSVYIVHSALAAQLPRKITVYEHYEENVVIQLVVGPWRARPRKICLANVRDDSVKIVPVRQIPFHSLFKNAPSVPDALRTFHKVLLETALEIDTAKPRVNDRSEPIPPWGDEDEWEV